MAAWNRLLPCLATAGLGLAVGHRAAPPPGPQSAMGGLVTLYAEDDLASSVDFRTGGSGARLLNGRIDLSAANLVYDALAPEKLTHGLIADQVTSLLDLGEIRVAPFVRATDPALSIPVSAFHTLAVDGKRFEFLDDAGRPVRLKEADSILGLLTDGTPASFAPVVGHLYLFRWRATHGDPEDRLVKFQVVEHVPGQHVTLRWAPVPIR